MQKKIWAGVKLISIYYDVLFAISFLLTVIFVFIWRKHFDIYITAIFFLVPITNLGYVLYAGAVDEYSSIVAMKIIYIGGCFLPYLITMCILNLCNMKINKGIRFCAFLISTIMYIFVFGIGRQPYFYKNLIVKITDSGWVVMKEYGPVHTIFYVVVALYFLIGITAIIYSIVRKNQVSNSILYLLFIPVLISVLGYFGNALVRSRMEILPVTYVFAQVIYLFIVRRMSLYNVSDTVVDSMVQTGETGFVSVDFKYHFLGANETAKNIIPELRNLSVDQDIRNVPLLEHNINHWIKHFIEENTRRHLFIRNKDTEFSIENPDDYIVDEQHEEKELGNYGENVVSGEIPEVDEKVVSTDKSSKTAEISQTQVSEKKEGAGHHSNTADCRRVIEKDDTQTFVVDCQYLFYGKKKCGYQLFITDDTKNQKYISLLDKYKTELEQEVKKKTQHIIEMHDNLILSMATMVESRDNSTGGHIKRTSICVRILVEEMKKDPDFELAGMLTDEFCSDIIKAAPMHDLGKVSVDDAVLRKPGKFTPEEYEKMKTHAAEGARIVHEILKDTDDESFKKIAENVAHYHHERMDGSGYPEGLKGDEIPFEARIMAIADVYDALVSKRVYKEKMSFEKADQIMLESMGKHFDKRLEPYYISARPKLEAYYNSQEQGNK